MTFVSAERRGRPVVFFASLLLCWVALRVATFETPWPRVTNLAEVVDAARRTATHDTNEAMTEKQGSLVSSEYATRSEIESLPLLPGTERVFSPSKEMATNQPNPAAFSQGRQAMGHNLAWMAGMSGLPVPASVAVIFDQQGDPASNPPTRQRASAPSTQSRWRVDGWLLLREGGARIAPRGTLPASYGASQIGAVLAFRLAPADSRQPSAYLRTSHALIAKGESEAALGFSLRPLPRLPVTAHAELRATHRPGGIEVRPAAFLSAGFARENLPFRLAARGYAQGGYVAGDFATGFAAGQVVLDRAVRNFDLGELRAGAGAWGGAQKDASRLDVGPTASFDFKLAEKPVRLALDYRVRVAGEAEPASGGALTLSTGF